MTHKKVDEAGKGAVCWLRMELCGADLYIFTRLEINYPFHSLSWPLFLYTYNKTIIWFGFCDIQNNQGLSKGYQPQPQPPASADNPYLDLHYSRYHIKHIQ